MRPMSQMGTRTTSLSGFCPLPPGADMPTELAWGSLGAINVRFASRRTAAKFASLFDEAGGGVRDMTETDRTGEHA
jgi:hypothetical protein